MKAATVKNILQRSLVLLCSLLNGHRSVGAFSSIINIWRSQKTSRAQSHSTDYLANTKLQLSLDVQASLVLSHQRSTEELSSSSA